jgi:hypothetical protein
MTHTPPRILGPLLFLQLAGLIVPFVLLHPMNDTDYLTQLSQHDSQIRLAVFLLFFNCALTIGISLVAWPVLRSHSEAAALLLVAASGIMFTLQAVDNAHLLSLLTLSGQYHQPGGGAQIETIATAVRSTRRWVHYSELFSIDAWIFILYSAFHRFRLIPRPLALFGLATVLLHFAGIVVPFFLGHPSIMPLGMPMAISHLALISWLALKGAPLPAALPSGALVPPQQTSRFSDS